MNVKELRTILFGILIGFAIHSSASAADPNLVAHWKFDESKGTIAYDSAGNNDGALNNGPTWTASGINGSLLFDGVDDYVEVPDSPYWDFGAGDFSISAWVRLSASELGNYGVIIGRWHSSSNSNRWELFKEAENGLSVYVSSDGTASGQINATTGVGTVTSDVWYHLVGMREGNSLKIYLNGTEKDSTPIAFSIPDDDLPVMMGRHNSVSPHYFGGAIDDVRIYNRALSAEEIGEIYESGTPVNYYYVDGVDGDDLNDGLTPETAFAMIQTGIDTAEDGDTVLVYPDLYLEELDFDGKAITVAGFDEPPVLTAPSFYAVSFFHGEDADSIFRNFIIKDSYSGFLCLFASPIISNVTVVDCNNGVIADEGSNPIITNSIFWNNTGGGLSGCDAQYSLVQDPITDGLVAHWKFDEGTGTTAYDSAGNNDGTLVNGPLWTTGQIDGALEFDGSNDYVRVADSDSLTPSDALTVSAWVRINAISWSERAGIVCKYDAAGGDRAYMVQLVNQSDPDLSTLSIHVSETTSPHNGKATLGTTALLPGEWYHLVTTFEANHQEIYVDGIEDTDDTDPEIADSIPNNDLPLYIGYHKDENTYFDGKMDDVMLYERVLTAGEVRQLYLAGTGPRFVDAAGGDYHLKSEGWRWAAGGGWTWDEVTSPCIDYGNPGTPLWNEPMSIPRDPGNIYGENIRVNMGAYGRTSQASMPPHGWALLADLNNDGIVDWLDVGIYAECWLSADYEPAGDLNRDGIVNIVDWALLLADWQQEAIW